MKPVPMMADRRADVMNHSPEGGSLSGTVPPVSPLYAFRHRQQTRGPGAKDATDEWAKVVENASPTRRRYFVQVAVMTVNNDSGLDL